MAAMQALLRVGIVRSKRAPTKTHPYGYMKDKFVWSLVSAVGIFCLGAGVTCAHGVSSLMSPPQQLAHLGYGLAGAPIAKSTCYGTLQPSRLSLLQQMQQGMCWTVQCQLPDTDHALPGILRWASGGKVG